MATYIGGRKIIDAPLGFTHTLKTRPFRGKAQEHIVIASQKLKRDIKAEEIVHHRDRNPRNNDPDNLLVLDSISTHATLHGFNCDESILVLLPDGAFTVDKSKVAKLRQYKAKHCSVCGTLISHTSKHGLCLECTAKKNRKVPRPDKKKLYELVWSVPTSVLAKRFGVSDKAITKWCLRYGIDKPPRGYWAKLHAGVAQQQRHQA